MLMNKKAETLKETVTPTRQNLIKKNLLFQMKKTLATTKGICPLKKTLRHWVLDLWVREIKKLIHRTITLIKNKS